MTPAVEHDVWWFVARAVEMLNTGAAILGPGVAVRRDGDDQVAVLYGGHRGSVDRDAVIAAGRTMLADWPFAISRVEILMTDRKTGKLVGELNEHDMRALAAASSKRERKAQRWRSRAS